MDRTALWFVTFQRLKFLLLSLFVVYLYLLPVDFIPGLFYPPHMVLILATALIIRKPEYLPTWLIFIVFLLYDFLLYQPLGLGALTILLGLEYLRGFNYTLRESVFLSEWVLVGIFLVAITLLKELILIVFLAQRNTFWETISELVVTFAYYPVAVICIAVLFRMPILDKPKASAS